MAILSREDFFTRIQNVIGTDNSEENISFIEDMTDTYNDMETRLNGDGEDWEKRYHELDESWKQRYSHRFFSGNGKSAIPIQEPQIQTQEVTPETISYHDLFN